jgi:hypothetical protein
MLQGSTSFRLTVNLSHLNDRFAHLSGRFLQIMDKQQVTDYLPFRMILKENNEKLIQMPPFYHPFQKTCTDIDI